MHPPIHPLDKDFRSHWAEYLNEEAPKQKQKAPTPKEAAQLASTLYANTCASILPFVILGTGGIRENDELTSNFRLLSSMSSKKAAKEEKTGAILDSQNWSQLLNDIFMMAVVNSRKEVHVIPNANGSINAQSLMNAEGNKLSHFGREIAILLAAGYKRVAAPPTVGLIFHCFRPADLQFANLLELRREVHRVGSVAGLRDFINDRVSCPGMQQDAAAGPIVAVSK